MLPNDNQSPNVRGKKNFQIYFFPKFGFFGGKKGILPQIIPLLFLFSHFGETSPQK
jgi:hypothetical protein